MLKSLASAFLMYSRIPMPAVEWKEENRRWSLCFFPLIGAFIGGLFLLWRYICIRLGCGTLLYGAVSMLIPIAVTGGIHLDGYCDVSDALASCAEREKRLEIMSDPHIGAFAAIKLCAYLIFQTAVLSQLCTFRAAAAAACVFVVSRSLSAAAAVTFKCAKKKGTLQDFTDPAHKRITLCSAVMTFIVASGLMIWASPADGIPAAAAALLCFWYYRLSAYKNFGGITGDLAGWFLQICEIVMLAVIAAAEVII